VLAGPQHLPGVRLQQRNPRAPRRHGSSKVKNGHLLDELREAFRDYEKGKR
jgi:hypothetical protein